MPNTVVADLQSVGDNILVAATNGRGAWAILIGKTHVAGTVRQALEPGHVGPGDPVEGVVITLDPGNGSSHALRAVSDGKGHFEFPNVAPGDYTVRRIAPPGWSPIGAVDERARYRSARRTRVPLSQGRARGAGAHLDPFADTVARPGRPPVAPIGAPDEFDQMNGRTTIGKRFWIEAGLAVVSGFLLLLTLVNSEWIEASFRVDPDGEWLREWLIVAALLATTVAFGLLAREERLATQGSGEAPVVEL